MSNRATCYALTLGGSRRKAQRKVEQLNGRDGLHVPIARTVEVRPLAGPATWPARLEHRALLTAANTVVPGEYALDDLVRRVLLSMLEQCRTRRPAQAHDHH